MPCVNMYNISEDILVILLTPFESFKQTSTTAVGVVYGLCVAHVKSFAQIKGKFQKQYCCYLSFPAAPSAGQQTAS